MTPCLGSRRAVTKGANLTGQHFTRYEETPAVTLMTLCGGGRLQERIWTVKPKQLAQS